MITSLFSSDENCFVHIWNLNISLGHAKILETKTQQEINNDIDNMTLLHTYFEFGNSNS